MIDSQIAFGYISQRKYQAALPVFRKCYESDPENPVIKSFYGLCLAFDNPPKFELAEKLCKEAITKELYNASLYVNLAWVYNRQGKRYESIVMLEYALRWDEKNRDALYLRKLLKIRRAPVFSFLPRSSFLNVVFGRIRHKLLGPLG
ncbi:MAG: hypothetical protein A2Y62_20530 [Candidatus Fischerbacteria bacterium RBG_13_37_8]|uniref:Uncharacterized protein n=1 Tax=Candidatus Fischerbacteria bacterium RBG_13_37_8 TaxID=1817863 RepID=A0A1F5VFW6_9BACT|nr:MAG: hypothetical protein A2Y62_20530 [Candidatus Fischerbacteria bacterium RBG_13_37_8]